MTAFDEVRTKFWSTMKVNLCFWPFVQLFNFFFISVQVWLCIGDWELGIGDWHVVSSVNSKYCIAILECLRFLPGKSKGFNSQISHDANWGCRTSSTTSTVSTRGKERRSLTAFWKSIIRDSCYMIINQFYLMLSIL